MTHFDSLHRISDLDSDYANTLKLAITGKKMNAARAPRSLIFFRAALPLALAHQMSAAHFALVLILKNTPQIIFVLLDFY